VEIRDGVLYDYRGNYSWFIERRKKQLETAENVAQAEPAPERTKEQKRAEAEERNRLYRERKQWQDKLAPIEKQIGTDEARKEEISRLLCDADVLADSAKVQNLMIELKETEARLQENYPKWEELSAKIEEIK
jgi:ATP-binding cassette subfamily F protein 3